MDQIKSEFLKKLTKFTVASIWVLSLFIIQNLYFKFTIQLVTHAVDKNYMFLLCNGLLVFVAKYSSLISSSKPNTDKYFDYGDFESYNAILECDHGRGTDYFLAEEVTVDSLVEESKYQETEDKDEKEDEEEEDPFAENDGEEEIDLRDNEEEEMNKKFEEFIRKMKEELRIEAKRHLILV